MDLVHESGSDLPAAGKLRFGPFTFDVGTQRLSHGDIEIHLTPKAAAVLCHLLQRRDELIGKDEFLETVWEGVHVREESLTQAISVIRQALGDSAQDPRYIQTVSGEGYRFIGEVSSVAGGEIAKANDAGGPSIVDSPPLGGISKGRVVAALVSLGVVALALLAFRPGSLSWPSRAGDDSESLDDAAEPSYAFDLVVLPVLDLGATIEQQRFAIGIGDELSRTLATLMPGGVVPYSVASNFDLRDKTFRQRVEHFDARFILELAVQWQAEPADAYRVKAELMRAEDAWPMWSETLDPGQPDPRRMFAQQERIADEVVAKLGIKMSLGDGQVAAAWPTGDLEAWREYLLGMEKMRASIYDRGTWAEAVVHFDNALDVDPGYLVAQAMRSVALTQVRDPERQVRGGELAESLVNDHADLPQARWALGAYYYHAARDSGVALGEDPMNLGRRRYFELAKEELEVARRALPYQPDLEMLLAAVNRRLGDLDAAIVGLEKIRRLLPEDPRTLIELATSYILTKQNDQADRWIEAALAINPERGDLYAIRAYNDLAWERPVPDRREALGVVEIPIGAPDACHVQLAAILVDAAERRYAEILDRRSVAPHCESANIGLMRFPFDLYAALAYRELAFEQEATAASDAARAHLEEGLERYPDNLGRHAALGLVHAFAGRRESALWHAHMAMDLRPLEEDAFQGSEPILFYIRTLAQLGDVEEAIEELDVLLSIPASVTITSVRNDPFMAPIVEHPGFQDLVDRYSRVGESDDGSRRLADPNR